MKLNADKLEIQKQWDKDPCGASTATEQTPGTLDFYRAVRDYRYNVYAPWFDQVVCFEKWQDKDILEIGVGLGSDHFRFARGGNRMTALDLSQEHLRQTQRHLELEGLTTTPVYGDAEKIPFADESFDVVYAFGVLHHTPDTEAAIAEINRVLRPGGTAIIGLYHRNSWFFWIQTLFVNGLLQGGLWRWGWRRLLSQIEYRKDLNSAVPLVKLYSCHQVHQLLSAFSQVNLTTCHVEASHFWRFHRFFRHWSRERLERRLGKGGWYILAQAQK